MVIKMIERAESAELLLWWAELGKLKSNLLVVEAINEEN